jgi:hypothetical protein
MARPHPLMADKHHFCPVRNRDRGSRRRLANNGYPPAEADGFRSGTGSILHSRGVPMLLSRCRAQRCTGAAGPRHLRHRRRRRMSAMVGSPYRGCPASYRKRLVSAPCAQLLRHSDLHIRRDSRRSRRPQREGRWGHGDEYEKPATTHRGTLIRAGGIPSARMIVQRQS